MFTGLVECVGTIQEFEKQAQGWRLAVVPEREFETKIGDSISVNGCCLTVAALVLPSLIFDLSEETLQKTTFADSKKGRKINLERAMRASDRFGGHIVQGHIDGVGKIVRMQKNSDGCLLEVSVPYPLGKYIVEKGSVCFDGVSLTVNRLVDLAVGSSTVSVMLIPTTMAVTTLQFLSEGSAVNVEVDILGKYLERLRCFKTTS